MFFDRMLDGFAYYKIIVDTAGKPVDYVFLEVNSAFERKTGLKREKIIGKRVTEVLPGIEKDPADWIGVCGRVALTGEPTQFENFAESLDKWYRVAAYCPANGHFVTLFEDITERKKAEEALRETQHDLNRAQAVGRIGSWRLDVVHNVLSWSDENHRIFGVAKGTPMSYETFLSMVHPDDRPHVDQKWNAGLRGEPYDVEHRIIVNGATKWVREKAELEFDKDGVLLGGFGTTQDITERKKAEEALRQSEQTFLELIERAPFGIYVVNSQFRIEHMNKGSQDGAFSNVRPVIGRDFSEAMHILWPEPTASEILSHFRNTLETGEPYFSPQFIKPRHDVEIVESYEWMLQRIRLPDGQYGVICYYFDSTKLRETERGLSEAQAKLKEYAANLEQLVEERTKQLNDAERLATIGATAGMVGHDLRNPLQSITGDIYLVKGDLAALPDSPEKESIKESIEEIQRSIDYVNKIVSDLQDYAKPLTPVAKETDLQVLIHDLLEKHGVPKNIKVSSRVDKGVSELVVDADFLRRIIGNLVSNAVQAMPNGGKLIIHAGEEDGDTVISVQDTGVGIPENVKAKLFTPLFTTKSRGQGFGLAVVKRMTEALGGTVTYESEVGEGTKFIVRLPPPKK